MDKKTLPCSIGRIAHDSVVAMLPALYELKASDAGDQFDKIGAISDIYAEFFQMVYNGLKRKLGFEFIVED